jgi:hypothetical protein
MHGWIGVEEFARCVDAILNRTRTQPGLIEDLARELATRHNDLPPRQRMPTNQQWCPGSGPICASWITQAIAMLSPCSVEDWTCWAGDHRGTWYDATFEFIDHAIWEPPQSLHSEDGVPAIVQPVYCYTESAEGARTPQRRGWNATLTGGSHVIGWDPKRLCDRADPHEAVHVGFPFRPPLAKDDRHCIVGCSGTRRFWSAWTILIDIAAARG